MWGILSQFVRWTSVTVAATIAYILFLMILLILRYVFQVKQFHPNIKKLNTICYFIVLWTTISCTILFWLIYFFKFDMINALNEDQLILLPMYAHHIGHTIPIIIAFSIGLFIYKPEYNNDRKLHIITQIFLLACYFVNMNLIKEKFNYWPYPFMNLLSTNEWICLFIFAYVMSVGVCEPIISRYFIYLNTRNNNKSKKF